MGLTGIQIFKLLPKTNCGECGVPTCLAFAMNLAAGKAELALCPYVSEEAKAQLAEASAPPIRPLTIGAGDHAVKTGGETVLFRHEKTFFNPTGLGALLTSDMKAETVSAKLRKWDTFQYERVGLNLRPELVAVKDLNGDAAAFAAVVKQVFETSNFSLILMSDKPEVLKAGLAACPGANPLLYAATKANVDAMGELAKEAKCPLAVKGDGLDELIALSNKLTQAGLKDLVLDSGARAIKKVLEDQVAIRRTALAQKEKALGFPTITFPCEMAPDLETETLIGALMVAKYGGIVVLSDFEGQSVFPLLLERLNIFTDPQRPMTVTQGIYEINGPDENSPVLRDLQLLPDLLYRLRRNRRQPRALLALDHGHRRPVGHDRLGGREIRGGRRGDLCQEMRDRRQGQTPQPDHPGLCGRHCRRPGRRTAGLDDQGRTAGSRPYSQVSAGA